MRNVGMISNSEATATASTVSTVKSIGARSHAAVPAARR
jgi:hypothetical protein